MNRVERLRLIAEAHQAWSLEHGDEVWDDEDAARLGEDYPQHSLDVSAPPAVADELNQAIVDLLAKGDDGSPGDAAEGR